MDKRAIITTLGECLLIGFLIRYTLVFAYEAILGEWLLNTLGYYMISGFLACFVGWLIADSKLFKHFKGRKREYINKKSPGDS